MPGLNSLLTRFLKEAGARSGDQLKHLGTRHQYRHP